MTTLESIAIKTTSRASMQTRDRVEITLEHGISGDFRGPKKGRQITILSKSAWSKTCDSLAAQLPWTMRRANLLVDGVEFSADDLGKKVRIGDVELQIVAETKPCSLMDQQYRNLKSSLTPDWRGGVCCDVLKAGSIRIGDPVDIA